MVQPSSPTWNAFLAVIMECSDHVTSPTLHGITETEDRGILIIQILFADSIFLAMMLISDHHCWNSEYLLLSKIELD
jgi:hypothetical protein